MATLAENIETMASLTLDLKNKYRLSENTILRIIDMNLAVQNAQRGYSGQGMQGPEDTEDSIPMPADDQKLAQMLGITVAETTQNEVIEDEFTEILAEPKDGVVETSPEMEGSNV